MKKRTLAALALLAVLATALVWRLAAPRNAAGGALSCTYSIRCDTALLSGDLASQTRALLPDDGAILPAGEIAFTEGESVFDVLLRETRERGIPMEFSETPLYASVYVEGIGNLYEFDCGALSGWMYRVNGEFPNYGSSRCTLQSGDTVEWVYTCDLGADVGSETRELQK